MFLSDGDGEARRDGAGGGGFFFFSSFHLQVLYAVGLGEEEKKKGEDVTTPAVPGKIGVCLTTENGARGREVSERGFAMPRVSTWAPPVRI